MCRVLIIDDDKFSGETIKLILEDAGEAQADYSTNYDEARELVKQAIKSNKPYEVFLIDQRLGPGKDGIEVMQELRMSSPDSDAIIFTGIDDIETGLRAYEAGAFRYLSKPFENRELLFLLKSLKQWRKEQREHNWQKLFTTMMEEALRKNSFLEVGNVVVQYALELGFSRAHLFWVPTQEDVNADNLRVGITCAGENCIPDFSSSPEHSRLYPLRQWFDLNQAKQSQNVSFLESDEAKEIRQRAKEIGYQWPKSEISFLPLWGSNRLLGELMLDHDQTEKALSKHELNLLNFFAQQAAIVLENVSLINREQRSVQETTTISQIGRQVTYKAAEETNLSELLDEVRLQVGLLIDVANFTVVLLDPESGELNISLSYKNGVQQNHLHSPDNMEIEKLLVNRDSGIFWPKDVKRHFQKNKILVEDDIPLSCIGVQLRVGRNVIGGIVVKNFEVEEKFTKRDHILLSSVANQISGAIQLIHVNEAEKRDAERLNVLRRAMMEMLRIAQEKEDNLWITVLTIATANFGTGFNRALLFLENEEHTQLILKAGIGTNDLEEARRDWENIVEMNYQFDDFLTELQEGKLHFTPFHNFASEITLPLNKENKVFTQVMQDPHLVLVEEDNIEKKIPREVRRKINPSTCAVLPIPSGNRAIGLVLVDNKHSGRPLNENMLNRLQTVASYAGLVWENLRQRDKSNRLLSANNIILSGASPDQLKSTLMEICETAQTITEADWVIIYPLLEGTEIFDIKNISYAGNIKVSLESVVKAKPRKDGVSAHVLSKGELIIPDINSADASIGTRRLANHHFIQREGVEALVGIAICDVLTKQNLGVLFLDYRSTHNFNEQEIHHARSFASLAAVAITNARRYGEQRHQERLGAALKTAQTVIANVDQDVMLDKILGNLKSIFPETSMCVLSYDSDENALRFIPSTLKYYPMQESKSYEKHIFPIDGPTIACKAARDALNSKSNITLNIPDVQDIPEYLSLIPGNKSELCISLLGSDNHLLGILALERSAKHGFSGEDQSLIETIARQLTLGLERTQQIEQLNFKNSVATLTSWAADIAHDINNEAGEIQGYTYLIKELIDDEQVAGYADKIEQSAQRLFDAGPKSKQGEQDIYLDQAIESYAKPLAQQRDIQIEFLLNAKGCQILVNLTDFRRMLQHLTRNADKAMHKMTNKKISIYTQKAENNKVEILFRDYGPGVPEDVQLSVFQKKVTTKQSGGFGLLLTRQFVEDMGGTIRLLPSEQGSGATFSIKIPIKEINEPID